MAVRRLPVFLWLIPLAVLLGCTGPAPVPSPSLTWLTPDRSAQLQQEAVGLLTDLEAGSTASTVTLFTPELAANLSESDLHEAFSSSTAKLGAFREVLGARVATTGAYANADAFAEHRSGTLKASFVFDADGKLAGLWLRTATAQELSQLARPSSAATGSQGAASTGVHSVDTPVQVGPYKLGGTLVTPAPGITAKPVVVLLVAGSGPNDRDETIGVAANKPFRDIADGLAAHGIASLRVDKRFSSHPEAAADDPTVQAEYLVDVAAALDLLRTRPELKGYRIAVLGHSQGGMVLPNILQAAPDVAGGVILAGSPRSLFDVIHDQNLAAINAATDKSQAEKSALLAQVQAEVDRAKALDDPSAEPVLTMPAAYVVSLNRLNSADVAKRLTVPLLVMQGDEDFQISVANDFQAWKPVLAGNPRVTFKLYPGLNHLFMASSGQKSVLEYDTPAHVDAAVIADLATWLAGLA